MKKKCAIVGLFVTSGNIGVAITIKNDFLMALGILSISFAGVIALYTWLYEPLRGIKKKLKEMEEENRQLENMRRDFVANVTHELKTPLTSIAGFIETLQNGAAEDIEIRGKFIDIIAIETARLERLIEDTLLLSDIEQSTEGRSGEIKVVETIQGVVNVMVPIARSNDVTVIADIEKGLIVQGNEDRFRQMMVNIIENAIKYSNRGGRVWIEGRLFAGKVVIKVIDEGIGISQKNLSRLFQRFYRVDKSRSRKVGGTGLGLSIVKHIAALLNAEVSVESKLGEGTTFIVTFLEGQKVD